MKTLNIIRPAELARILSVSRATLWRMEKRGVLPPKITISKRAVGWKQSDIEAWIDHNTSERQERGDSDDG